MKTNGWIAEHAWYPDFKANLNAGSVLGTHEWVVHNDSKLCSNSDSYSKILSFSSCSQNHFTCSDGNCVEMDERCDGRLNCMDGSDEQQCRLVVPSIGYNKFLSPPPINGEEYLYVNVSYDIKHILYIDEVENFIRISYNIQKDWYDSLLTYKNLKKDSDNLIFREDKNMIWYPWLTSNNIESINKQLRADDKEILKIVPNNNFKYKYDSKTMYQNSFLYEVRPSFSS